MGPFTRIVCPIDFSDASQHALEHAVVIAQWYDAAIVGLHVANPTYAPIGALDLPDDGGTMFAGPATSSRLQLQMAEALAAAKAAGVPVEICIEEGSPAGRILSGVADHRADWHVTRRETRHNLGPVAAGRAGDEDHSCPPLTNPTVETAPFGVP